MPGPRRYAGADCAADRLAPIPHHPLPATREDMKLTGPRGGTIFEGPHQLLPPTRRDTSASGCDGGRGVARAGARRGRSVSVDYAELPWVAHSRRSRAGAPSCGKRCRQRARRHGLRRPRETERAFAAADRVFKWKFDIARCTAVTIEPRAALGVYDPAAALHALRGTGGAVRQKKDLAAVLASTSRRCA